MQTVKKIDIHVHTSESGWKANGAYPFATPEELIAIYDQVGIEKGVLLPVGSFALVTSSNYENKRIVDKYPDRFVWFCFIEPWAGTNSENTDFLPYLLECKENGARGYGEAVSNCYFDDPRVLKLMACCEKAGLPFTFHIGNMGGDYGLVDEIGLPRLEKVLQMFPNLKFLGHSQKFWAEISGDLTEEQRGGYPTGKVAPGGRVVELMRKYPNLYGDMSAGSGYNAMARDPEFAYAFMEEFQDRLFFGTDICTVVPLTHPVLKLGPFLDEAMQTGKISYDAYYKISRGNAIELLGLEPDAK